MQATPLLAAFAAGILVGAGGLYLATQSSIVVAGPPALVTPSNEEASAAMAAHKRMPETKVRVGQCDKNTMGPGVSCIVDWEPKGDGQSLVATVGFSKSASGQWVATHYY